MSEQHLTDRTVLITGGSRGIGQAIVNVLGNAGAYVIATATSESGVEKINAAMKEQGIKGHAEVLDIASSGSVNAMIERLDNAEHKVDTLVNNAGITKDNLFMRMKDEEWEDVLNTNLTGMYRLSKAFVKPMMKARSGHIVNISSVVGLSGNPGQTNYSAAKAGMIGFTKSLARELGARNITVNAVAPGFIETDMTDDLPESVKESLLNQIPLARLGQADEVANVVEFLISDKANYITGQTISVNGGMYMG